jgi:hypothetical protein
MGTSTSNSLRREGKAVLTVTDCVKKGHRHPGMGSKPRAAADLAVFHGTRRVGQKAGGIARDGADCPTTGAPRAQSTSATKRRAPRRENEPGTCAAGTTAKASRPDTEAGRAGSLYRLPGRTEPESRGPRKEQARENPLGSREGARRQARSRAAGAGLTPPLQKRDVISKKRTVRRPHPGLPPAPIHGRPARGPPRAGCLRAGFVVSDRGAGPCSGRSTRLLEGLARPPAPPDR